MTGALGTVDVTRVDGTSTWVVVLTGEHDMSTTRDLELRTSAAWPDAALVVVDLSATAFIDCSVVGWLLRADEALAVDDRQRLRVVPGAATGVAGRVFAVLDLARVLACYPTRADALDPAPIVATQQYLGASLC